ncbi:hypothetical protein, partial [Sphingobium sp.]|uniref:hypothetical protein n=1 Tax=Sphingobium sp. TaxID=1912891 RepID=UPI0035C6E2AF
MKITLYPETARFNPLYADFNIYIFPHLQESTAGRGTVIPEKGARDQASPLLGVSVIRTTRGLYLM